MSVKILKAKNDIIFKIFFSDERNVEFLGMFLILCDCRNVENNMESFLHT